MNKTLLFAILTLLLSTACKKSIEFETLSSRWPIFEEVYALKDTKSDSALKLMEAITDTMDVNAIGRYSKSQFYEYQILLTELWYKNDYPISNDSVILAAFYFYDSLWPDHDYSWRNEALCFQKARAYFVKAVLEENKTNQHLEAFSDYLNALWLMNGLRGKYHLFVSSSSNVEYEHFTAMVYDRLAWFLYTYDAWDVSLECLEKSSDCFNGENYALGVASNYELMGDVMLAQGDRIQSMVYYKRSDSIHGRLNTGGIYQHFSSLVHRSLDLYNAGEKEACLALLFHALEANQNERLQRQLRFSLGYFYFEEQRYDSALYNYERSYPLLPRQTIKSYCRIIKAANMLGDSIKAAHYGELLSDAYQIQFARSSDRTKMIMLYESYKAETEDLRQRTVLFFVLILVFILLTIIAFIMFLFERRRRHHKKDIEEHEKIQASLVEEIESAKKASLQKEEQINALQSKLDKVISNPDFQTLPFDKKIETLYELPICKRIRKVKEANVKAFTTYPELILSENQLTMLVNAVDAVFPRFSVRIIEMYPRLKRNDVVYCCLYILGISEVQAAALTGKTYQAVWTRSLKLHEIFDNKSNIQFVLNDILKNW